MTIARTCENVVCFPCVVYRSAPYTTELLFAAVGNEEKG